MTKYKTIIVDDHRIFKNYLCSILNQIENVEISAQVSNGLELLNVISSEKADMVFMEINCSIINSAIIIKRLLKKFPQTKIIATSLYKEDEKNHYSTLMKLGVHGFLLKQTGKKDLENAIKSIMNGEKFFSPDFFYPGLASHT